MPNTQETPQVQALDLDAILASLSPTQRKAMETRFKEERKEERKHLDALKSVVRTQVAGEIQAVAQTLVSELPITQSATSDWKGWTLEGTKVDVITETGAKRQVSVKVVVTAH